MQLEEIEPIQNQNLNEIVPFKFCDHMKNNYYLDERSRNSLIN